MQSFWNLAQNIMVIVMLCAKFQNDWSRVIMDEGDFVKIWVYNEFRLNKYCIMQLGPAWCRLFIAKHGVDNGINSLYSSQIIFMNLIKS